MARRLALTIVAGVAATLVAVATAFAVGWGPTASSAETRPGGNVKDAAGIATAHEETPAERSGDRPHMSTVARSSDLSQSPDSEGDDVNDDANDDEGFQDSQEQVESQDDSGQEAQDDSQDGSQEDVDAQEDNHEEANDLQDDGEGGGDD